MRLSRRSEYGLRALVDLVRHQDDGPIALAALAERDRLPTKFLEQIMSTLKHAGIVRSTLGAHGGYALAADPADRLDRSRHPAARWRARAARLRLAALLRAVFVRRRGDLPAARRDARRARRDARDPRRGDAGRPGRAARSRLDRPAWPPRRCPRRSEALTGFGNARRGGASYRREQCTVRPCFEGATQSHAPDPDRRPQRLRQVRRLRAGCLSPAPRRHVQDDRPALQLAEGFLHADAGAVDAWHRTIARGTSGVAGQPSCPRLRHLPRGRRRHRRRALPAGHPRAPARDRQGRLCRSLRADRPMRRRRRPLCGYDHRRVERLDRDALQLDPGQPGARGGAPQYRRSSRATRSATRRW